MTSRHSESGLIRCSLVSESPDQWNKFQSLLANTVHVSNAAHGKPDHVSITYP